MANERKYDESLVGFFENESKYGLWYQSLTLTPEIIDKITANLQEGGRLKFRILGEEKRKKLAAYLDFVTPDKVASKRKGNKENDDI